MRKMRCKFEMHVCLSAYNLSFGHPIQTHTQKTSVTENKSSTIVNSFIRAYELGSRSGFVKPQ